MSDGTTAARVGPVVDSNVHLWDQRRDPVFWLTDRTLVRDMIGNYDSLPDEYTLADYLDATSAFDVQGVVWSDAGASDPVAAAEWVRAQDTAGQVVGLVSLGDVDDPGFEETMRAVAANPLVTGVRIRLVTAFQVGVSGGPADDGGRLLEGLALMGEVGLVATLEAGADQLGRVADVAQRLPDLTIVLDHFGWPSDLSGAGRDAHLAALRRLADTTSVATRIDAIGTIFGDWDVETIRPWLQGVVAAFGPGRCMLGSDLPIETLRSTFGRLYAAYDSIFASMSDADRRLLFGGTARRIYGAGPP